jgi:hypothetical protein
VELVSQQNLIEKVIKDNVEGDPVGEGLLALLFEVDAKAGGEVPAALFLETAVDQLGIGCTALVGLTLLYDLLLQGGSVSRDVFGQESLVGFLDLGVCGFAQPLLRVGLQLEHQLLGALAEPLVQLVTVHLGSTPCQNAHSAECHHQSQNRAHRQLLLRFFVAGKD